LRISIDLCSENLLLLIHCLLGILSLALFGFHPDGDPENHNQITIDIDKITNPQGYVMVAVYNSENDFLTERVFYRTRVKVEKEGTESLKMNLPPGKYAVAVYQDVNGDNVLNKTIFGIPKEPYGFSGDPFIRFGAPNWSETSLMIDKDLRIRIQLN